MIPYRVKLPDYVLNSSNPEASAKRYMKKNYPERYFIRIEKGFAICNVMQE